MECVVCGRPISSLDEDGICANCSNKRISDTLYDASLRRSLTRRELEALPPERQEVVNE